jgi:hypothetical protein
MSAEAAVIPFGGRFGRHAQAEIVDHELGWKHLRLIKSH